MKIIRHCSRAARYALFSGLVATALALSVVRFWLLPQAAHYRGLLQTQIGAMIGETVHIDGLAAGMQGFSPTLVMQGFEIIDAEGVHPPLRLREVRIKLSLIGSLMAGSPTLRAISLEGASVTLQRNENGSLAVLGLKVTDHPPAWLFAEGEVEFRDIELAWRDRRAGDKPLHLGQVDFSLRNIGDRHQLNADLALPHELGKFLRMAASIDSDPLSGSGWKGRFYLEGRSVREALFGDALPADIKLKSGEADFKLWGDWQDGTLSQFIGRVDLTTPLTVSGPRAKDENQITANQMGGWFRWRNEASGWWLDVKHFKLSLDQHVWPETSFSIAINRSAEGRLSSIRAATSYLRLGDVEPWLHVLPAFKETDRGRVLQLAPRGEMQNLALFYEPAATLGQRWAICGELIGVSFSAWQDVPGANRLHGKVCGTDQHGQIQFTMRNAALHMAKLFEGPIRLDALDGKLDWRQTETEWRITSPNLELRAGGMKADGRFHLALNKSGETSPFLDLRARIVNADAASLRDYLPLAAMPKASAAWLGGAFVRGRLKEADVLFHGFLADFPFARNEGVFEAVLDAEEIELNYDPEWPHLFDVAASLRFHNAAMTIQASGGRIGEAKIKRAEADALDFVRDPWLTVTGEVETSVPASMRFLQQTPLRYIPERLMKVADPNGEAIVALKLKIPLMKDIDEFGVDGSAQLKNASLAIIGSNLNVDDIDGTLHFTQDGLDAQNIKATMLGESATINVAREGDDILIEASGRTQPSVLQKTFPSPLWKYTEGVLDYHLSVGIRDTMDASNNPLRMILVSDLNGLAVNLPQPLAKTAQSRKDTRVELTVQAGSKTRMRLAYGDELRAQLLLSELSTPFALVGGDLAIGRLLPSVSREPGLGCYINLAVLDLDAWGPLVEKNGGSGEYSLPVVRAFDVSVGRINWKGTDLGHLSLSGQRRNGQWSGELDSAFGKGRFHAIGPELGWPSVKLDLDVIKLPQFSGDSAHSFAGANFDPAAMPALQISGKQLFWQNFDLGAVDVETEHWTQGLNIKKLSVQKENHQLNLKGGWMREDDRVETKIDGQVIVQDMGQFLSDVGRPGEIRETPADMRFNLAWPGAPYQFSAGGVAGEIQMKLGRGGVLKMEPGVGRVLGMLNLYTLRRLLLLDFSDLFGKGLAYDSMDGRFQLDNGQAKTKSFVIDAVAAKIVISGRVGLVARDFDQTVAVIPHTLATLPVAGALVGGAAFGAAISAAKRLIGEESANIASTNYSVKGSWDDPQIARIDGYMPLEMLDRVWTGLKDLSGFGARVEESQHE